MEQPLEMPQKKCILCSHWSFNCRSLSSSTYRWFHEHLRSQYKVFDERDLNLCTTCVADFYKLKETLTIRLTDEPMDIADEINENGDDNQFTLENITFGGSGHKKCVVCRQDIRNGAVTMPKSARLDLLVIHSTYAPKGVRCCSN
ncbi:unnamed protein product, partial [Adineta ricciae]